MCIRDSGVEVRVLLNGSSSARSYTITIGDGDYEIVDADVYKRQPLC